MKDRCPLCGTRRARRACPALGRDICPVCCGTKRLVEIRCPADCTYLASARAHPAASVQRQQGRDLHLLAAMLRDLSEAQYRLLAVLQTAVQRYRPTALPPLTDADVAEAAGALAATFETAARGIIYEHRPASLTAERLELELKAVVDEAHRSGGPRVERDAAVALRRIERAARDAAAAVGGGPDAYLDLLDRIGRQSAGAEAPETRDDREPSRLVIP